MPDFTQLCGWHDRPADVAAMLSRQDFPLFGPASAQSGAKGNGKGKRVLLYEAIYKAWGGRDKYNPRLQTIGDCFPAGAPVLMADGSERAIEQVQVGDMVMSHLNRPQRVLRTIAKPFSGELVTITPAGYSFPLTATADHRLVTYPDRGYGKHRSGLTQKMRKSEQWDWQAIGEFAPGDRVLLPRGLDNQEATPEILDIRKLAGCDLRRYKTVCKGTATTKPFKNAVTTDSVAVDERFARFVGLFLAEGSCEASRIAFSLSRTEELLAAEIIELGRVLFGVRGIIDRMPSKPNVLVVKFNSTPLARFFTTLIPGNVWTKAVPACFMRASRAVRYALLRGWCDGDGSGKQYNQNVGTSTSKALRYTMARLAISAGLKPSCPRRAARGRSKESGNVTFYGDDLYKIYPDRADVRVRSGRKAARTELGLAMPIKTITRQTVANTQVFCLEVEEDHSFVVSGYAVHNCVSQGSANAVDALRSLAFVINKSDWIAETASEPIYAMSRVEIGKGQLGGSDGSVGAWAAEAVKTMGTLVRQKYGKWDLTKYDGNRAKQWGAPRAGCPDELEPIARQFPVRTTSLVTTWEEYRDSIAAGYPVTIASNRGFTTTRDKQGFLKPSGSWPHQMCGWAVDDASGRPGGLIINSWGKDWVSGPTQFDQPPGSFWVDAEVLVSMLKQQDAWAYSDYVGFPVKKFDLGSIF